MKKDVSDFSGLMGDEDSLLNRSLEVNREDELDAVRVIILDVVKLSLNSKNVNREEVQSKMNDLIGMLRLK